MRCGMTAADVLIECLIDWGEKSSLDFLATASMESWSPFALIRTKYGSSRFARKRPQPSWPADRQNLPESWESVSRPRVRRHSPSEWSLDAKLDAQPILAITGLQISRRDWRLHPAGCRGLQRARYGTHPCGEYGRSCVHPVRLSRCFASYLSDRSCRTKS